MIKIGIVSNAYEDDSKFRIDFKEFQKRGYESLDYQNFISSKSELYKMSENDFVLYLTELKEEMDKYGLFFNQLHALWDTQAEKDERNHLIDYYVKSIKAAGILKCPYVVIHPVSPRSWDEKLDAKEMKEFNIKFMQELIPYCKENNTKLAIENLPFPWLYDFFGPEGTLDLINSIDSEYVVMCVDTGHFNMFRDVDVYDEFLKIGNKLKVLHIHDNNSWTDSHNFPYMGSFNWDKFIKALKDIKFDGVLSLETSAPKKVPSKEIYEKLDASLLLIIKNFQNRINE